MYDIVCCEMETVWGKPLKINYRLNTNDLDIATSILSSHFNEYHVEKFSYVDGDVFIDLGSHIGMWSILMASRSPTFKVYSYEAIPENYEIIMMNKESNNLANLYPFNIAIADSIIYYPKRPRDKFIGAHRWIGSPQGGDKYIVVPSITLDEVFDSNKIDRCRVLKTDMEGSEIKAFRDISERNLKKIDYVIGEFHPWNVGINTFYSYFQKHFIDATTLVYEKKGNMNLQNFLYKARRLRNEF
uniref:Putative methyltransferase n=1 Tax=viral metagenome TaxID=1070528 RepID=A0A6M3Y0T1_9ZZZZ